MNSPCRLAAFLMIASIVVSPRAYSAPEKPEEALLVDKARRLIVDLDSDSYQVREAATRALSEMGQPAIAPLAEAIEHGTLEVVTRAITALDRIYVRGDNQTVDAVEAVLEGLSRHKNQSIAGRAEGVLERRYEVRERRAMAEIRKAGGIFIRLVNGKETIVNQQDLMTYHDMLLHIGETWKAGDDGLRHVKRLSRLQAMRFIPGVSGVTREGIDGLTAALPSLSIHERGAAKLGMRGQPSQTIKGCEVVDIEPGSAADDVDLQERDIIVKFDDKPVEDFDALVELIKLRKPGDKVSLQVFRMGQDEPLILTPVLKGWE